MDDGSGSNTMGTREERGIRERKTEEGDENND
jgi:hypothetical protein